MSKLFNLKEWLTLDEAATHISNVLGEQATIADLYRFALDGHLTLSADFINHVYAKKGKRVKTEDVEFYNVDICGFFGSNKPTRSKLPKNYEVKISDDDWIALEKLVVSIEGVWDLTMDGDERLDIEHSYQQLTSGLEVTLTALGGVFVKQGDVVCQLQTDCDDIEFQEGSKAYQKNMELQIIRCNLSKKKAAELRAEFKKEREKYLEKRESQPNEKNYFPSVGLQVHDYVLVVRTRELTRFIQSLEGNPKPQDKPLHSKERNTLLVIIAALCKQVDIDPSQRGVTSAIEKMTEELGSPITDDTIRKILVQLEDAVSARSK